MGGQIAFGTQDFADNPEPRCPCLLLLDVSGSMTGGHVAGVPGLSHRLGDLGRRRPPGPGSARLPRSVGHRRAAGRGLYKLDTLLAALRVFREGVVAEFELYDQRQRELEALRE